MIPPMSKACNWCHYKYEAHRIKCNMCCYFEVSESNDYTNFKKPIKIVTYHCKLFNTYVRRKYILDKEGKVVKELPREDKRL